MEDGLGRLGFWLMVGMVGAAAIVSKAIKERDKERDKQATLRALLEKDGTSVTEVLDYIREKDAEEAANVARDRAWSATFWIKLKAIALGIVAFGAGIFAFSALRFGIFRGSESVLVPLVGLAAMFGIWAAGLIFARRIWHSAKYKNDACRNRRSHRAAAGNSKVACAAWK